MVKIVLYLFIFASFSSANILSIAKTFLDDHTYRTQRNLVNILFSDKNRYINTLTGNIDTLKIVKTLKANGLLKLSYSSAKQLTLSFNISNHPLLSMKIINNILQSLGYTYYLTKSIHKHGDSLRWKIIINTQNLVDPIIFVNMLQKRNCNVLNIRKNGEFNWIYEINSLYAKLQTIAIRKNRLTKLKQPNQAYWIDPQNSKSITIKAHPKDSWYPMVSFFDEKLNTLYEFNIAKKRKVLKIKIPTNIKYIKIEDKFLLNNIKRGLNVELE